ncbi:MAG: DHH family phosphoesterase [Clostridia bacterium]|nr:DHH family phosphoesterase [Clostridia bacterium]
MNETITSVSRFLLENDNYVIGIHANPDGDCFGSACGLAGALKKLGKNALILSPNSIPKRLSFLNYSDTEVFESREGYDKIKDEKHTYITVDVASDHLLGEVADVFQQNNKFAIDHHEKNTITAEKLYLDNTSSAAGEIVYKIICELEDWTNETIWDDKIASSVFGAISSDTGCFKYGNTTPETHRIAASLIEKNADSRDINYRLFDLKSSVQIAVESLAYRNLEYYENGKISFIYLSNKMLESIGAKVSDTETVSQLGRGIEGVQIAAFMRDKAEGEFKISVRCNIDTDLSVLCASLGIGGGHKKAAGCTVFTDSPQKAKEMFLEKAKDYIE